MPRTKPAVRKKPTALWAIPPLDHGVPYASIRQYEFVSETGIFGAVDDGRDGNRQDERAEEPVGNVDV